MPAKENLISPQARIRSMPTPRRPRRGDMGEKTSSTTITSTEVRELLRTAAKRLSAREEKAVRMRSGASVDRSEVLPRRGQQSAEARAQLLALEIELKGKVSAQTAGKPLLSPVRGE